MKHLHESWTLDGRAIASAQFNSKDCSTYLIGQPLRHCHCLHSAPRKSWPPSKICSKSRCLPLDRTLHAPSSWPCPLRKSEPRVQELPAMIHPRKLAQLARKWQKAKVATARDDDDEPCCTTSPVAGKGHCAVYTADGRRFEVPLAYLGTTVFGELLRMSREEFGFTAHSRITLPCDAAVMEYVMYLLRRNVSEEVERAFLSSVVMPPCQYSGCTVTPAVLNQQFAVCSS